MKTFAEIREQLQDGAKCWAIGSDGKRYEATYKTGYAGGVMFFAIPSTVEIIGYEEQLPVIVASMNENALKEFDFVLMVAEKGHGSVCPADLMYRYAKGRNDVKFDRNKYGRAYLSYFGRKYLYDHWEWGTLDEQRNAYPVRVFVSLQQN